MSGADVRQQTRYFVLMAGFGFDAVVVRDVLRPVKDLVGPAAYALSTLGALAKYRSTAITLTLDGEAVPLGSVSGSSSPMPRRMPTGRSSSRRSPRLTTAGWTSAFLSARAWTGSGSRPRWSLFWPAATCATPVSAITVRKDHAVVGAADLRPARRRDVRHDAGDDDHYSRGIVRVCSVTTTSLRPTSLL